MSFLLLKSLHIIAVVSWFAGLFYLPRLFVYHAMTQDQTGKERFKVMERKLYRGIMAPAAIISILAGVAMIASNPSVLQLLWMQAKLVCVLLLVCYHLACGHFAGQFAKDANTHSHVFFRWFNEIPTLLLVAIVLLAVVKPL